MVKIVVDAMGGDNAPEEIVKGALLALRERENFSVLFTGDEARIRAELAKTPHDASRVEVRHCTEEITNDDVPTHAIRSKRDSSLVVGMTLLKEDPEAAAFVSAGSTGAVLTGGIMLIGRIKGVLRPALCPGIPNVRGSRTLLCDCGANAECKPQYLEQFAVMASAYGKAAFHMEHPRVGLLTNGTEEHKGDTLHQEAHQLLKANPNIEFAGNIEGRDIMFGDVDVAVADGFSGNIALKSVEGCGKTVSAILKREFKKNLASKLAYLCARKQIKGLADMLDYAKLGGSVFLGLKKVVVKSHGSSKANAICPSVIQALDAYNNRLVETIEEMLTSGALENRMRNGEDLSAGELEAAQEAIGYPFHNLELLKACFTHRSYSNVFGGKDNERLEFLGDAVLELAVTEELFRSDENREGVLTERRQQLVSQSALEAACDRAGLMRFLRHSGGEKNLGGKTRSNLFEAVIGGIYLDGGMECVRPFLKRYLMVCPTENYKTLLQEYVQEREKRTPVYFTEERGEGYRSTVTALGERAEGFGESKKSAETAAAQKLYQILTARDSIEF